MSDEEDYMSESFLHSLEDKKPGLSFSSKTARSHQQEKKKKEKDDKNRVKPKKVLEAEKRVEGLNVAISSENKGFALLSKMGYKPGMALGKKGEGRCEPVPIELKTGRGGLGREVEMKRKVEDMRVKSAISREKRQKLLSEEKQNFVGRMRSKFSEQRVNSDLYKSQKVCADLDARIGLTDPDRLFFWPDSYKNKSESDEEESSTNEEPDEDLGLSIIDQLEVLTDYLRTRHLYCVWCGTAFEDAEDIKTNCPGNTAELHDD